MNNNASIINGNLFHWTNDVGTANASDLPYYDFDKLKIKSHKTDKVLDFYKKNFEMSDGDLVVNYEAPTPFITGRWSDASIKAKIVYDKNFSFSQEEYNSYLKKLEDSHFMAEQSAAYAEGSYSSEMRNIVAPMAKAIDIFKSWGKSRGWI